MDITQTLAGTSSASAVKASSSNEKISSDFETFLKMLTVQMKNQDPLSPIKSEDFAVQLATFSGVEQAVRTNDLLTALGAQMGTAGMAQLAGWVGMQARAPVPGYFDGAPLAIAPNPSLTADSAVLVVRNESGAEVQRTNIPLSKAPFDWAGVRDNGTPFPQGLYRFEVESYSNGSLTQTSTAETYGTVIEARLDGGQTVLVLQGGAEVQADDVTALRNASASG
jgi:flagellar basal-body rod modification protein FlgD